MNIYKNTKYNYVYTTNVNLIENILNYKNKKFVILIIQLIVKICIFIYLLQQKT